jgi:hypothetical protein
MGSLIELIGRTGLLSSGCLLFLHCFEYVLVSGAADLFLWDGREGCTTAISILHFESRNSCTNLRSHLADHTLVILEISTIECLELW